MCYFWTNSFILESKKYELTTKIWSIEAYNKEQTLLKPKWFEVRVMEKRQVLIEEAEEEVLEKIKCQKQRMMWLKQWINDKSRGKKKLREDKWQLADNWVLEEEKMYMWKDVYVKGYGIENRDNLVILWHTNSWPWCYGNCKLI